MPGLLLIIALLTLAKLLTPFQGSPGNSRSGGLHAHLDVQAEAGQHVDQHIVLVSRTGPLTTTNRNAAFPVSAGLAVGNYDRLFFEEVRFYQPFDFLWFVVGFHIGIDEPADHALILSMVLCCLRFEELDTLFAESNGNFHPFFPESKFFGWREKVSE